MFSPSVFFNHVFDTTTLFYRTSTSLHLFFPLNTTSKWTYSTYLLVPRPRRPPSVRRWGRGVRSSHFGLDSPNLTQVWMISGGFWWSNALCMLVLSLCWVLFDLWVAGGVISWFLAWCLSCDLCTDFELCVSQISCHWFVCRWFLLSICVVMRCEAIWGSSACPTHFDVIFIGSS